MDCDGFCPCSAPVCAALNSVSCKQMVTSYLSGTVLITQNSCIIKKWKKKKESSIFQICLSSAAPAVFLFPFMRWLRGKKRQGEVLLSAEQTAD